MSDGIDATFLLLGCAPRPAVVIKGAQIPFAIPARLLDRCGERFDTRFPAITKLGLPLIDAVQCEVPDSCDEEPGQPYALAASPLTDPIHAVIPIPGADQGKAVSSEAIGMGKRAVAVNEQRLLIVGNFKSGVTIGLAGRERRRPQKWNFFVQNGFVAGRLDIVRDGIRKPDEIVGAAGSDPAVRRRVPPMEHVALFELVRSGGEDMLPRCVRIDLDLGKDVLELIAKSERAAGLIETGASAHAGT
ncbi:hypothetical protein BF95_09100 [Sphingobium sp. Ant17]|nr:hypothetical protein BF95_09100 [Sphingobium sp. Ant17]